MWDMLYAFGIGIAFALGVGCGAWMNRIATKEGRQEEAAAWQKHQAAVEQRLGLYVQNTALMAKALERMADR